MNKFTSLTPTILAILRDKGTEKPFSSNCERVKGGTYLCRGCGYALFRGSHQFHSQCGWPSFDNEIKNAILREPDIDGIRTEILCAQCNSHLGHVFLGENLTEKNIRHCVNGLAIEWVQDETVNKTEETILAAGCFWGVEYLLKQKQGVLKTEVGFIGGHTLNPSYQDICNGNTGHVEAVRVLFNPEIIGYDEILKFYFEIHDPEQANGQGPDIGAQYHSVIFYYNENQQKKAKQIKQELVGLGYQPVTKIKPISTFWPAENYHQDYYQKTGKTPYCHVYQKKWY